MPENPTRMPVLFVGHGSPMHAIEDNAFSRGFAALGRQVPRPRAILAVSAHWVTRGTQLTDGLQPKTIHDFGGFPDALYRLRYPAPGDPALVRRAQQLLGERAATASTDWGLDHGTWCVLRHAFPAADVPVVQLSLDATLTPSGHVAVGRALRSLRDEGVLVFASGNLTHNLADAFRRLQDGAHDTPDWAARFDAAAAAALAARDTAALERLHATPDGRLAHPSAEHWLPVLHAYGASDERDAITWPITGWDLGSLSMRSVRFG